MKLEFITRSRYGFECRDVPHHRISKKQASDPFAQVPHLSNVWTSSVRCCCAFASGTTPHRVVYLPAGPEALGSSPGGYVVAADGGGHELREGIGGAGEGWHAQRGQFGGQRGIVGGRAFVAEDQ